MSLDNAFFNTNNDRVDQVGGYPLYKEWWSRCYEYPWALKYARPGMIVADMGCGWMERPFKRALAEICLQVEAIDLDPRVLNLAPQERLSYRVADFSKPIEVYMPGYFHRIFCISVLEDLGDLVPGALREFRRLLSPGGLIVLTFDVQHDLYKPLPKYPGVNLDRFVAEVRAAGLAFTGLIDQTRMMSVYHAGWNLACFHCVLEAENGI